MSRFNDLMHRIGDKFGFCARLRSPKYKNYHILLEITSLNIPMDRRQEAKEQSKRSVDMKWDSTSKKNKNKSLQLSLCLNSLGN